MGHKEVLQTFLINYLPPQVIYNGPKCEQFMQTHPDAEVIVWPTEEEFRTFPCSVKMESVTMMHYRKKLYGI